MPTGLAARFVGLGVTAADSEQERAHKATLTLIAGATAPLVLAWAIVYGVLGLPFAAAIPSTYTVLTLAGLVVVARTKRIRLFRLSQSAMWLLLPFILQWSLGGFANGSAVRMWAITAPLLASVVGARPWPWMAGFAALALASGLVDAARAANAPFVPGGVVTGFFVLNFLGIAWVAFISLRFFITERERTRLALEQEREKSERLLLNVLPEAIADRLKSGEQVIADRVDDVTILFADLVGSTALSERLSPEELVELLDGIFSSFDDLADRLRLEKIKTVGDAYMVVGGLPVPRPGHVEAVAEMALSMREELGHHSVEGLGPLAMRYGIHSGTVVAGVIGRRKFSYDLWGDTVNTAARMESHGIPGEIQVSEAVYRRLRHDPRFRFRSRGPVDVKGKGRMQTYLLDRAPRSPGE